MMDVISIDNIGGNCPVQAEGRIAGQPFYFRARGNRWSMSIGGDDVVGEPDWYHEEPYGEEPYAAGWMTESEARVFIGRAADIYLARDVDDGQPTEAQEWHDFDPDC